MSIKTITPNTFEAENHYYEKVLNSTCSPTVSRFLNMSTECIIERYTHLNPSVSRDKLTSLLSYKPTNFRWAGADLFNVTNEKGEKSMVLIETNSCPSGQKSMPHPDNDETGGYGRLIKNTFMPMVQQSQTIDGRIAVLYDKNKMEASGYASCIADVFKEDVLLVKHINGSKDVVKFDDDIMYVNQDNTWVQIRVAFRYVTQKPWNRIPINTKTLILNPIISCIAGGRNKLLADIAYEFMNNELYNYEGLSLQTPYTKRNVKFNEVPLWIKNLGGIGVVKNPYSNAGQGVWTITNETELNNFKNEKCDYEEFIVQGLIGNYKWSSRTPTGKLFHVGTIPNKHKKIYVADIRMMVHYDYNKGFFRPLVMYARRAQKPLETELSGNSWESLGTNLSVKIDENNWGSDTTRLLLMDQKDFDKLGLGIDDLINGYIQTVLATIAIDKLSCRLLKNGIFDKDLFMSLNKDAVFLKEIMD